MVTLAEIKAEITDLLVKHGCDILTVERVLETFEWELDRQRHKLIYGDE